MDIGILGREGAQGLLHVEGVAADDVVAAGHQTLQIIVVFGGVGALHILRLHAEVLGHLLQTLVGLIVDGLIAQRTLQQQTDLHGRGAGRLIAAVGRVIAGVLAAAGRQRQHHDQCQQHRKNLLHVFLLVSLIFSVLYPQDAVIPSNTRPYACRQIWYATSAAEAASGV